MPTPFAPGELDQILKVARIFDDNGYEILGEQLHYVHEKETMEAQKDES